MPLLRELGNGFVSELLPALLGMRGRGMSAHRQHCRAAKGRRGGMEVDRQTGRTEGQTDRRASRSARSSCCGALPVFALASLPACQPACPPLPLLPVSWPAASQLACCLTGIQQQHPLVRPFLQIAVLGHCRQARAHTEQAGKSTLLSGSNAVQSQEWKGHTLPYCCLILPIQDATADYWGTLLQPSWRQLSSPSQPRSVFNSLYMLRRLLGTALPCKQAGMQCRE